MQVFGMHLYMFVLGLFGFSLLQVVLDPSSVFLHFPRNDVNANVMQVVPGFRVRIIPVMGTIPAIFGQVMATYVVTQIAGLPVQTEPVVNLDVEHYGILHRRLIEREELQFGSAEAVEVLSCTDILPWV